MPPPPPLVLLEFEPGDEALSAVGDLESDDVTVTNGGDEELDVVEVSEAIEKWAAAAAAAAGNKNGGILGAICPPMLRLPKLCGVVEWREWGGSKCGW